VNYKKQASQDRKYVLLFSLSVENFMFGR